MSKATAFGGIVGRGGGGVCGKVGYALFLLSCSGLCSSIGKPAHKKIIHYIFNYSVTHADLTAGVFGVKHLCELLSRRQWYIVKHSPVSL